MLEGLYNYGNYLIKTKVKVDKYAKSDLKEKPIQNIIYFNNLKYKKCDTGYLLCYRLCR